MTYTERDGRNIEKKENIHQEEDMNQHNIPYPIVSTDGKTTHVLVPIEDYLRIIVQRDVPPSGYTFFPYEVSEKTLYGISPL